MPQGQDVKGTAGGGVVIFIRGLGLEDSSRELLVPIVHRQA